VFTGKETDNSQNFAVAVQGGERGGDSRRRVLWKEAKVHVPGLPWEELEWTLLGFFIKGTNIAELDL
jgi:hypothetical protein